MCKSILGIIEILSFLSILGEKILTQRFKR